MNMQLKHCFAGAKFYRLKKSQILSVFSFPKTAKGVQIKPELQHLASKKSNWQPWSALGCSAIVDKTKAIVSNKVNQWRLVVKLAGGAAKFHLWLNIWDCRPGCFYK